METSGDLPGSRDLAEPRRLLVAGVKRYGGVTYTRAALLQLRGAAVVSRPYPFVTLLRRLGLSRRRHRGVRAGRKSRRPITMIVTTRHQYRRGAEMEAGRYECRFLPRPAAPNRHLRSSATESNPGADTNALMHLSQQRQRTKTDADAYCNRPV